MNSIKSTDNLINGAYTYKNQNLSAKKSEDKDNADNKSAIKEKEPDVSVKKSGDIAETDGVYSKKTARKEKERTENITSQINLIRQKSAEQLVQMVYDILNKQGRQGFVASKKLEDAILGLKNYLENGGTVTPEEQSAAAAAIADGGPWSVDAVSDRLVEMAVKFADGDESKYNMMKSAIEAGFKAAEAAWGGQLPEISYKTFEATMTKLAAAFGQTAEAEPA